MVSGGFPASYKHAIVTPLLKNELFDKNNVSNYRLLSNLLFLSKMIECIVLGQLLSYLTNNNVMPLCQSGYRRFHSTETALLQVISTLFASMEDQKLSLLALLIMSAAFDCVDHALLHDKLTCTFMVHLWISCYVV